MSILTDAAGRPIPRPERSDFGDAIAYLRAVWTYRDRVAAAANAAFDAAFRAGIRADPRLAQK